MNRETRETRENRKETCSGFLFAYFACFAVKLWRVAGAVELTSPTFNHTPLAIRGLILCFLFDFGPYHRALLAVRPCGHPPIELNLCH